MSSRPHIVIFNPDQWRGDVLGHLGNPAAVTPNLDRMVNEDGVSFRYAFCQNPMCTPSRCSFMSGWYPHVRGHRTMTHMMQPDEPVLLKTLKDNGYFVWWGGKNDLVPGQNGYSGYCDVKYSPPSEERTKPELRYPANWRGSPAGDNYYSFYAGRLECNPTAGEPTSGDWAMVRGAVDLVRRYDGDRPLCLYLPLTFPHPPYAVEDPWYSMIERGKVPSCAPIPKKIDREPALYRVLRELQGMQEWTKERWAELRATYYGMCARVDHQFGMLMDALKDHGLYDDTAVFFFSDHGDFTGDYGVVQKADNVFPDGLVRVPFIIKPPEGTAVQPRVSEALVELIDFPATVEALTGIEPKHTHFGRSLLPVLSGKSDCHRDAVFCEGGRRYGEKQCLGLELIPEPAEDNLYWSILKPFRTESPEIGKAVMLRTHEYKYIHRLYEQDELYNLRADPMETVNRIDDSQLAGVLAGLRERLMKFYLETADVVPFKIDKRD